MNGPALSPIGDNYHVSDKIRHMALYCDFGAALIVWELFWAGVRAKIVCVFERVTAEILYQVSEKLNLGFRLATIYRGLNRSDLGAAKFFSKSDRGLNTL